LNDKLPALSLSKHLVSEPVCIELVEMSKTQGTKQRSLRQAQ